ncbi:MAG: helix-turn-helix domain-containing protein [Bacteroidota bacterium]
MSGILLLTQDQFEIIRKKLENIETLLSNGKSKDESEWISSKEAQEILGVGETTLWSYRKDGLIQASKINKRLYFKRSDLLGLIESKQLKSVG